MVVIMRCCKHACLSVRIELLTIGETYLTINNHMKNAAVKLPRSITIAAAYPQNYEWFMTPRTVSQWL